jgi:hypothetical protein
MVRFHIASRHDTVRPGQRGAPHHGLREQYCHPEHREQPRAPGHREILRRPCAGERHEDHESADHEKQVYCKHAKLKPRRTPVAEHALENHRVVKDHHHHCGDSAQHIELGDAGSVG